MKFSGISLWQTENPSEHSEKTGRDEGRLFTPPEMAEALPDTLTIARIVLAAVLILMSVFITSIPAIVVLIMRIVAAIGVSYDIVWHTARQLRAKDYVGDGLPVILAVILAFANGASLEAAIAMTVLQIALCARRFAYCKTTQSLAAAVSLPSDSFELAVGDSLMLEGGGVAPADCMVVRGTITADFSYVNGKRAEKNLKVGDVIPAGCAAISGSALVEVIKPASESAASSMAEAIIGGYGDVTRTERAISSAAKFIIPEIFAAAAVLLVLLPLVFDLSFADSLRRVTAIVVIASPCGALFSIPLVYYAAMVHLRRNGMVFRSSKSLDNTAFAGAVVLEKSGTITMEDFEVTTVSSDKMDLGTFIKVAAHAAAGSENPMAQAIVAAYAEPISTELMSDFSEFAGWGVSVTVNGIAILLGTGSFMMRNRVSIPAEGESDCVVYMAFDGLLAGWICMKNAVNHPVMDVIEGLAKSGLDRIVMISGDSREQDGAISRAIGIGEYYSECTDEEKASNIKALRSRVDAKKTIVYVSGAFGSALAAEAADAAIAINTGNVNALDGAADAIFLSDDINNLTGALSAGRRTRRNAIVFALTALVIKLALAALAAVGIVPLWFALVLDSCVSLALITGSYQLSLAKRIK